MWTVRSLRKDVTILILTVFIITFILVLVPNQTYTTYYYKWARNEILPFPVQLPAENVGILANTREKLHSNDAQSILDSSSKLRLENNEILLPSMIPPNTEFSNEKLLRRMLVDRTNMSRKVLTAQGLNLGTSGDVAKRVIIVTTWRSGSTFTAEVLGTIPGVFYHYEPLMFMAFDDLQNNKTLENAGINTITQLLNCNYSLLGDYLRYFPKDKNLLNRNSHLAEICKATERELCLKESMLSFACQQFPLQITKSVRLPLRSFLPLLRKPELNLHVVLLVRDPRGTIASRRKMSWCKGQCLDPKRLCSLLQDNYETALQASKEFPDTFTVLRYEDLAVKPTSVSTWLFERLGLPQTTSVTEYIRKHTTADVDLPWSTTRRLGSRVAIWRESMPWEEIEATQDACHETLTNYGYAPILNLEHLTDTDTVLPDWALPTISPSYLDA